MNRLGLRSTLSVLACLVCLAVGGAVAAQTSNPPKKVTPTPAAPGKPPAKAAPAPAAKTATTPAAKAAVQSTPAAQPMSQPAVQPAAQTVQQPVSTTSQTTPSNLLSNVPTAQTQANGLTGNTGSSRDPRSPVVGQGLGNFLWGPWSLTAYGCFRTGTRIFCDFDAGSQNNVQAGANLWSGVNLVDDGGKVTGRHNAFFLANDGTQMTTAYFSPGSPVRMIMEYDDVAQNYTSVSLVVGADRIRGVPITPADPSQPAGTIPGRGSASASGQAAASGQTPASSPVDQASQVLNNATAQQKKAQGFFDQLKSAVQSH